MSVTMNRYLGLSIELDKDLDVYEFLDKHPEYNEYGAGGVRLISDGMNGNFTRLVYLDYFSSEELEDDYVEINSDITGDKLLELIKAYKLLTGYEPKLKDIKYLYFSMGV